MSKDRSPIVKVPGKRQWLVKGLNTGRVLGRQPSKAKAKRQLRGIEWRMHGGKSRPRGHRIFKLRP